MADNHYTEQYSGYGGNPYGQPSPGYASANPYGGAYNSTQNPALSPPAGPQHNLSTYTSHTQESHYSQATPVAEHPGPAAPPSNHVQYIQPGPSLLSVPDFLARVEAVKADIRTLTTHVGQIASLHQRALSATDSSASAQLESMITQTQVLNTSIKDQIKLLEADAVRSKDNNVKNTQISQLKTSFTKQLQEYRQEEASYQRRYREQIARQYRIVNPEATDAEVAEAADADWGNEGVFETALKTNRTAAANTVLGAVRARHNDIMKIERTMIELQQLMEDLATAIVLQEPAAQQIEASTGQVLKDTEAANVEIGKATASARRARKMKWWCFFIVLAILIILGLVLGLYFGLHNN